LLQLFDTATIRMTNALIDENLIILTVLAIIRNLSFEGANEPVSWWWCQACKGESAAVSAGKTVKQKKAAQAASGCMRLDAAWGRSGR
jgi:hypothetical protein